eukprot:GHVT01005400.1.p1 GENE.GHVT01005400.1~~GHVT01005400.1.p1  ORF type:complete len:429 (-),score=127.77 GHVT01005400.1:123-1409(-)
MASNFVRWGPGEALPPFAFFSAARAFTRQFSSAFFASRTLSFSSSSFSSSSFSPPCCSSSSSSCGQCMSWLSTSSLSLLPAAPPFRSRLPPLASPPRRGLSPGSRFAIKGAGPTSSSTTLYPPSFARYSVPSSLSSGSSPPSFPFSRPSSRPSPMVCRCFSCRLFSSSSSSPSSSSSSSTLSSSAYRLTFPWWVSRLAQSISTGLGTPSPSSALSSSPPSSALSSSPSTSASHHPSSSSAWAFLAVLLGLMALTTVVTCRVPGGHVVILLHGASNKYKPYVFDDKQVVLYNPFTHRPILFRILPVTKRIKLNFPTKDSIPIEIFLQCTFAPRVENIFELVERFGRDYGRVFLEDEAARDVAAVVSSFDAAQLTDQEHAAGQAVDQLVSRLRDAAAFHKIVASEITIVFRHGQPEDKPESKPEKKEEKD